VLRLAWYIRLIRFDDSIRKRIGRPIRFEIRFERKKTIRRSLVWLLTKRYILLTVHAYIIEMVGFLWEPVDVPYGLISGCVVRYCLQVNVLSCLRRPGVGMSCLKSTSSLTFQMYTLAAQTFIHLMQHSEITRNWIIVSNKVILQINRSKMHELKYRSTA